jgi:hypothetical protein
MPAVQLAAIEQHLAEGEVVGGVAHQAAEVPESGAVCVFALGD